MDDKARINTVVETPFEILLKGNIKTTFGTDFNYIAQSILDRGFDKAVIITDGYASMSDELKQPLKALRLVTLTFLFDDAQTCDDFAQFGEVVHSRTQRSDNYGDGTPHPLCPVCA